MAEGSGRASEELRALIAQDRKEEKPEKFSGTFAEYLDLVEKDPAITQTAHARIFHEVIKPQDRKPIMETDDARVRRLFKDDPIDTYPNFQKEFFGIERTIAKIARYFHAASLRGEESRQVLYLMGPVGSGKSSLSEFIKDSLERSRIYVMEGCDMFHEPLLLVPRHLRKAFEEKLGVRIEGDICPKCKKRLKDEYNDQYENFPVVERAIRKNARIGIGVVPPVDANNQDTSVLIGSEDISKLDIYGENDPRALDLDGAMNVGNRGLVEFIEVFKNETEYLHAMLTATQEKVIPAPGRHGMVSVDTCIIAHSNEAEWQKFRADHTNEAILDRIVTIKTPYNLRLSEEVKIYQKIIRTSDFRAHVAPHTLELASMFAILSRLEPTEKTDLLTKLKLYNGEEVVEGGSVKAVDVRELQDEAKREGMSGVSTRFIMKALDNALSASTDKHSRSDGDMPACINPISVREALIAMTKEADLPDDEKKRRLEFLQDTCHKEYLERLEREITKAFVYSYEEQAEQLFQNYLDHAQAFVNKTKVRDRRTEEELEPDEGFLKSIEEEIAIIGTSAPEFRQQVLSFLFVAQRDKQELTYKAYEPLKEAIEKKLMTSVRDMSRIVTKARTRDERQQEKYSKIVESLLEHGYCEECVDVTLKYAANNLWKD